jgi:hypothetical protein
LATCFTLIAPREFVPIRGEVRSANEKMGGHSRAPPVTSRSFAFDQVRRLDELADVEPIFLVRM